MFLRVGIGMSYKTRSERDLTGVTARTSEALNDLSLQVLSAAAMGIDGPDPVILQDLERFLSCKKVSPSPKDGLQCLGDLMSWILQVEDGSIR